MTSSRYKVDSPQFRAFGKQLAAALRATGEVRGARKVAVSPDRHSALVSVHIGSDSGAGPVEKVVEKANGGAFEVGITGYHSTGYDFGKQSQTDLEKGELAFGLPAALIVLVLVFGAVVAGLVPVLMAILSIIVALGLVAVISLEFSLSVFIVNMLTGMGLALGIDYSLFVVSRYREERKLGLAKEDAIALTGATASRAVLFSGTHVRDRAARHVHRPDLDHAEPRARGDPRRHRLGRRRADAPARAAQPASATASTARASRSSAGTSAAPTATEGRFWRRIVDGCAAPPGAVARGLRRCDARPRRADLRTAHRRERRQHAAVDPALEAGLSSCSSAPSPCRTRAPVRIVAVGGDARRRGRSREAQSALAAEGSFGAGTIQAVARERTSRCSTSPIRGDAVGGAAVSAVRDLRAHVHPGDLRRQRGEGLRRRHHRRERRLLRRRDEPDAVRAPLRARAELRPAHGRVPLDRRRARLGRCSTCSRSARRTGCSRSSSSTATAPASSASSTRT